MDKIKKENAFCPIDLVLHIIESKWIIRIVRDLCVAPRRPSELVKSLKGINPKTLTDRLRDLEKWNLVERRAYQEIPPRVEYSLTPKGEQLIPVMTAFRQVGESWQNDTPAGSYSEDECSHCTLAGNGNKGNKVNECPVTDMSGTNNKQSQK